MTNPYFGLDDYCFWSKSMTQIAPGRVDPVVNSEIINPDQKIATMGSCFAQHISKHMQLAGFNYFITEQAPHWFDSSNSIKANYGVFSARYGNVYTVKQAVQLFDRAFSKFCPVDDVWRKKDIFVDAFRPQIEPDGFLSEEEVKESTKQHLECVRKVFLESDWLIFTLGLTEAWRSKLDNAIYPVAPGVAGGCFDPERYEFVNFTTNEVRSDLFNFIDRIKSVNPKLKILLTLSPVPLIATYENRHVWVSTTFSKAALRVAADEAERKYDNVIYFPSYEIITSPASNGRYYQDDLRQVTELGVKHVMRVFGEHFFSQKETVSLKGCIDTTVTSKKNSEIVCDEEMIEESLRNSGFF
jgi:hypothetical protein